MTRRLTHLAAGSLLVVLLALLFRLPNFSHEPVPDELYHLLAAQSWVETGTLAIGDGEYTRASAFTRLVALVYEWSGGDLDTIRIACIAVGTLYVLSVFVAVFFLVGGAEATIAGVMLALMPGAIFLSQFIRFYTLHALSFWLAAIGLYVLVYRRMPVLAKSVLAIAVALLLAFSMHLQRTTLVGIAGLAAWLAIVAAPHVRSWFRERHVSAVAAVLVLAAAVAVAWLFGPFERLLEQYLSSSMWSTRTNAAYYVIRYRDQYGLFWSMFPVAAVIALLSNRRPAVFCLTVFAVSFVLHSFAGMRSERYLFYAMPFFVTTWGIALREVFRFVHVRLRDFLASRSWAGRAPLTAARLSAAILATGMAWIVLLTPATELSVRMALDRPGLVPRYWFNYTASWELARSRIDRLVEESDVFVTSKGHHAYYYIGDFDVEISLTGLSDFWTGPGGSDIDPRTGRRVIATAEELQQIVYCQDSGVIVVDRRSWRNPTDVSDEVADFMERFLESVTTPAEWGMRIFRWRADDEELAASKAAWGRAGLQCDEPVSGP